MKAIILAAKENKLKGSNIPTVLNKIGETTIISHIINELTLLKPTEIITIVNFEGEKIENEVKEKSTVIYQSEILGTGFAVSSILNMIDDDEDVLILGTCFPFVKYEEMLKFHVESNNDLTVYTSIIDIPNGYGRIVEENGKITKITEQVECNDNELKIQKINTGIYLFKGSLLKKTLDNINNINNSNHYYLTDTIEIAIKLGKKVETFNFFIPDELANIKNKMKLAQATKYLRTIINNYHMENGVTIVDSDSTYIDKGAKIMCDAVIYPNCVIGKDVIIGENSIIGVNSRIVSSTIGNNTNILSSNIENSSIGDNSNVIMNSRILNCQIGNKTSIESSVLLNSTIGEETSVGPFAYVRPNSKIGSHCKIGDFVEVKNAIIGDNTKASHLTYIGDADLGKNINLGCGTVTVNYDGKNKFRTVVEDNAFIGCNSNLVAPVTVRNGAYIAAGSTITNEVPSDSLAIARARQVNKDSWKRK